MKYAVVKVTDGNYNIESEGYTDIAAAIVQYHGVCRALWNDKDTTNACVMIVNENLDKVEDYKEVIDKTQPNA